MNTIMKFFEEYVIRLLENNLNFKIQKKNSRHFKQMTQRKLIRFIRQKCLFLQSRHIKQEPYTIILQKQINADSRTTFR